MDLLYVRRIREKRVKLGLIKGGEWNPKEWLSREGHIRCERKWLHYLFAGRYDSLKWASMESLFGPIFRKSNGPLILNAGKWKYTLFLATYFCNCYKI